MSRVGRSPAVIGQRLLLFLLFSISVIIVFSSRTRAADTDCGCLLTDTDVAIVGNTANSGPGSLRQAVLDSNALGDVACILFDIPDSDSNCAPDPNDPLNEICTIKLSSSITISQPVEICGFSQPGAQPNTGTQGLNARYKVVVQGDGGTNLSNMFFVNTSGVVMKGLVLNGNLRNNTSNFIFLQGDNHKILGNYFGTTPAGDASATSVAGTSVRIAAGSDGNQIGGTNKEDRNLISGQVGGTVFFSDSWPIPQVNNRVEGNIFNTDASGMSHLGSTSPSIAGGDVRGLKVRNNLIPNQTKFIISLGAGSNLSDVEITGNKIGTDIQETNDIRIDNLGEPPVFLVGSQSSLIENNIVSGIGDFGGIVIQIGNQNIIRNNRIGVGSMGTDLGPPTGVGRDGPGIAITGFADTNTGGNDNLVKANIIANLNGDGIQIGVGNSEEANGNYLSQNSIYDIVGKGINLNDPPEGNNGISKPQLLGFVKNPDSITVRGTLPNTVPGQKYEIQVYSNPQCSGPLEAEGRNYVGSFEVPELGDTVSFGIVSFERTIDAAPSSNTHGTLTATFLGDNITGVQNKYDTSEFSNCLLGQSSIRFREAETSRVEGAEDSEVQIVVERSGDLSVSASVNFSISNGLGDVVQGGDYVATAYSGTLNWAANDGDVKLIHITVVGDGDNEEDETVNINLSNPTGGFVLGDPAGHILRIVDDDSPRTGRLNFPNHFQTTMETSLKPDGSPNGYNIVNIPVNRIEGKDGPLSFTYEIVDIQTTSADTEPSNVRDSNIDLLNETPRTETFSDGEIYKLIPIKIFPNLPDDPTSPSDVTEDFKVEFTHPNGFDTVTVSIRELFGFDDEDDFTAPGIGFNSEEDIRVNEGATVEVQLLRVGSTLGTSLVDVTISEEGGAKLDEDYTPSYGSLASHTIAFPPSGMVSYPDNTTLLSYLGIYGILLSIIDEPTIYEFTSLQSFQISIADDNCAEGEEYLTVKLINVPVGHYELGSRRKRIIINADNDTNDCSSGCTPACHINSARHDSASGAWIVLWLSLFLLPGAYIGLRRKGPNKGIHGQTIYPKARSAFLVIFILGATLMVAPSVLAQECGDGAVEGAEECDDGNINDCDGCSGFCTIEACGNGYADCDEECDDGNLEPGDGCNQLCAVEVICGDFIITGNEECDDGNTDDGDGCDSGCMLEDRDGDGILNESDNCPSEYNPGQEDANCNGMGDSCDPITAPACTDHNACNACESASPSLGEFGCWRQDPAQVVQGYPVCRPGLPPTPYCGDGTVQSGELCDDGNYANGDGCTSNCVFETLQDQDGDLIPDPADNCPALFNVPPIDYNQDGLGDACSCGAASPPQVSCNAGTGVPTIEQKASNLKCGSGEATCGFAHQKKSCRELGFTREVPGSNGRVFRGVGPCQAGPPSGVGLAEVTEGICFNHCPEELGAPAWFCSSHFLCLGNFSAAQCKAPTKQHTFITYTAPRTGGGICDLDNRTCVCGPTPCNPADCNDNNICTVDKCDPETGCQHAPVDPTEACNDNDSDTVDTCDPVKGCLHARETTCGDGDPCDDGNACTSNDRCSDGACAGTAVVCTAQDQCHEAGVCDPANGVCSNPAKADGTTCDDGSACTASDQCQGGACTGAALNCDDGNACNGAETCNPATGCVSGNPPACGDGNVCTDDSCNPATGCVNTANQAECDDDKVCTVGDYCSGGSCVGGSAPVCDDGLFCNGIETCSEAAGGCVSDQAPVTDDGDACTVDYCDEENDKVVHESVSVDDGDACTQDSCDPATGPAHIPIDNDGDGSPCGEDCDDGNPSVYPGNEETCDGLDNDCDGQGDDEDTDGDEIPDCDDGCPADPHNDLDGDGHCGDTDNCPDAPNPDQADGDGDGKGDACQSTPGEDGAPEDDGEDSGIGGGGPGATGPLWVNGGGFGCSLNPEAGNVPGH